MIFSKSSKEIWSVYSAAKTGFPASQEEALLEPVPKKRGRPLGSKNKPKEAKRAKLVNQPEIHAKFSEVVQAQSIRLANEEIVALAAQLTPKVVFSSPEKDA